MAEGRITWLNGPVLRAHVEGGFAMNEAVQVGPQGLLGEIIRLRRDEAVVQVYEDTSGLRVGDRISGQGQPMSVSLGPSLLGRIFDGLLRPLGNGSEMYVHPGRFTGISGHFPFRPLVEPGEHLPPGARIGRIEPEGGRPQFCLLPPTVGGRVVDIAAAGDYPDTEPLCRIQTADGEQHSVAMAHAWPVREPRPIAERHPVDTPMVTGLRVIDSFFPVGRGSKAGLPGGFGTGKTVLLETLAKNCDADIIVYVGCGERGNELAGVLEEFPQLEDPRSGRPLMERTVIIANTSNMPVAAREASVYTGITVAEYFRDQGLHVAVMADSTSRWAEALREVSGRLGELPSEGGYPAYLSSRLADFYERAARVRPLGGGEGSVTLIGAVSPPSGDFSEPVTTHTKRYVRSFWTLDRSRAEARFYPAVHPLNSYSEEAADLDSWWQSQGNPGWLAIRRRLLSLLEEQTRLERMARIVGKDALPADQQLTLLGAELVNKGFLSQSAFSRTDRYCSPARQTAMLRLIEAFLDGSRKLVDRGVDPDRIRELPILRTLQRMGEEVGEEALDRFEALHADLDNQLAELGEREVRSAG